jgi:hypothetical protein
MTRMFPFRGMVAVGAERRVLFQELVAAVVRFRGVPGAFLNASL